MNGLSHICVVKGCFGGVHIDVPRAGGATPKHRQIVHILVQALRFPSGHVGDARVAGQYLPGLEGGDGAARIDDHEVLHAVDVGPRQRS